MKTLIYRNQQPIDELKDKLEKVLPILNNAYQLFTKAPYYNKSLGLFDILNNLEPIRKNYKMKLIEKEELPKFTAGGLKLSREKYADLAEVQEPEGIRSAIYEANNILVGIDLQYFEVKRDKVVICKKEFQKYIDKNSIYAGTQKEQIFLQKYKDMAKSIEEFSTFLKSECDLQLLPMPLAPLRVGLWYEIDAKGHYQVKPDKFELLAKRMKK